MTPKQNIHTFIVLTLSPTSKRFWNNFFNYIHFSKQDTKNTRICVLPRKKHIFPYVKNVACERWTDKDLSWICVFKQKMNGTKGSCIFPLFFFVFHVFCPSSCYRTRKLGNPGFFWKKIRGLLIICIFSIVQCCNQKCTCYLSLHYHHFMSFLPSKVYAPIEWILWMQRYC